MGAGRIRIKADEENAAVRLSDKTPPFSDDMRHDGTITFDTFKFRQEDIYAGAPAYKATGGGKAAVGHKGGGNMETAKAKQAAKGGNAKGKGRAGAAKAFSVVRGAGRKVGEFANKYNEDLRSERKENLGLRAVDESKNAIVRTKKAVDTGIKTTRNAAKYTGKAANTVGKAAKKAAEAAKKTAQAAVQVTKQVVTAIAKLVAFLIANPIVLVILIAVIVIILLIFQGYKAVQNTPRNIMGEELYRDVQTYLREKDGEVLREYNEVETLAPFADIAEEDITKVMEVYPATSMKLISSYLVAKYENGLTLDIAKQEIDAIHGQLYRVEYETSTETYEEQEPILDASGNPLFNPDGTPKTQTVLKQKLLLTVTLTGQTLKQYFDENLSSLLTDSQIMSYDWFVFVSGLFGGEVGPPFEDDNYMAHVTQEFGQPGALDGLPHRGMDFSYPEGAPVLSVTGGTVVEISNHWSWGLTVVIESGDGTVQVRYAHLSAISVNVGDIVAVGDTVGAVGSTGVSSGPHLHLEIMVDGQLQNPRDYLSVD